MRFTARMGRWLLIIVLAVMGLLWGFDAQITMPLLVIPAWEGAEA